MSPSENAAPVDAPAGLLYLLTMGSDKELMLRIHGSVPTTDEISAWMRSGSVRQLTVSRRGGEPHLFLVNFGHVVGARIAPFTEGRSGSF